ncbi:MAG: hypothetical protein KKI02_09820 [Planctomycetes bacterium]|nr:hypothetical protein [Planctomycetota bacterium]
MSSIDSAAGIGGLLATEDVAASKDYLYLYDANGNVGQVLDASDGTIAAKYEYDVYGNNLLDPTNPTESGPYAADKRPDGRNVLTAPVLREPPPHDGPRIAYGEGCRLGPARLKCEGIVSRQTVYETRTS